MTSKKRSLVVTEDEPETGRKRAATALPTSPTIAKKECANKDLMDILLAVGENERAAGRQVKYKVYVKAVNSIAAYPTRITSGAEARKLDGIGEKIAAKIDEILQTGELQKLEQAKKDPKQQALLTFTEIHGVGPVTARKWVDDGVLTMEDLKTKISDATYTLSHEQQLGLKFFDAFQKRIPRDEMLKHEALILEQCKSLDRRLHIEIVGSFRRGAATCGDVDVLVTHPDYNEKKHAAKNTGGLVATIVEQLKTAGYIIDQFGLGQYKFSGVCKLPGTTSEEYRKLDIKLFPKESFACALLHFTGSGEFNRQLRLAAMSRGLTLSELGICAVGETAVKGDPLPADTEEDIFAYCGVPYVAPNERNL